MTEPHTHNEYVSTQALIPVLSLVTAVGKSLVRKGLITKQEIIAELQVIVTNATDQIVIAEISELVTTVGNW